MTLQLNLELDVPAETLEADVAAFEETRTAFEQHGDEVPSLADLAKFMSSGDADPDLVAEANERLAMGPGHLRSRRPPMAAVARNPDCPESRMRLHRLTLQFLTKTNGTIHPRYHSTR